MKYIRIVLAGASLVAMTLLFVMPAAAFCRYVGWLPRAQLVPAIMAGEVIALVAIVVSLALLGRVYCAVVCPLGIAQDLARWVFRVTRIARLVQMGPMGRMGRIARYVILVLFVGGIFLGFTGLIAPYGIFGRFLSAGVMRVGEPPTLIVIWAISLFAVILLMTVFRARWWCGQVCPVGTFLGLFSRFALFRVRIDASKCVKCRLCAKICDKGAIVKDEAGMKVDHSLCTACLNCKGTCRKEALTWR